MKTNEDNRSLLVERTDNEDKFDAKGYPKPIPGEDISDTDLFVPGLDLEFDQTDVVEDI
jgi:hypothetical protein